MLKRNTLISAFVLISLFGLINGISSCKVKSVSVSNVSLTETLKINEKEKKMQVQKENDVIGFLNIPRVNIKKKLYNSESSNNVVDKNVSILLNNSNVLVLAAHSGSAKNSYFKNLYKLKVNDLVFVDLDNMTLTYRVDKIYTIAKTGFLNIKGLNSNDKKLVLTTCGEKKDTQLIVECLLLKK